jgi:ABC-type antimicrobial peptide transport system permease subunit
MGVIALLLAAMGIYGVMSHSVAQQRKEIGIRMALGAGRGSVVGMVTRTGLSLTGIGLLLGLPLAWLMFRGFTAAVDLFADDVGFTYALALTGALVGVAALSTWLPALRASGVSPVRALREE